MKGLLHELGRRWSYSILGVVYERDSVYFNELKKALEGIPPKTLSDRLRGLVKEGLMRRKYVFEQGRHRTEYTLTEKGVAIYETILSWK